MLDCSQLLDSLMDREPAPCLVHKVASMNTVILADCCLPAQHKDVGTQFATMACVQETFCRRVVTCIKTAFAADGGRFCQSQP